MAQNNQSARNKRQAEAEQKRAERHNAQRRTGDMLKSAIYDATVQILENEGYEAITFAKVAKRCHTSRSVIYRYWDDLFDLIFEAGHNAVLKNREGRGTIVEQTFNSGNLRQDLIDLLTFMRDNITFYPKNFLSYAFFEMSNGRNILNAGSSVGSGILYSNNITIERILARAEERGEAREDIGEAAKLLPFQMQRYHIMAENQVLTDQGILALVDDVLLPIYLKK